ncbi:MAG: YIP1 family protein [Ignavibacteriae bacterium]|nr:YIP1 family protein [Ignavibacteriota bacterium]
MEIQEQAAVAVEPTSFMTRATNVFASPGELYDEVSSTPVKTTSWLLPYLLSILLGILSTIAIANNQSLRDQILGPQRQEIQKKVDEGKMTQEQMERASEFMESSTMFMTFGIGGSIVVGTVAIFGIPLVLWLISKGMMKAIVGYKKVLEVYGLATLIGLVGSIVTLLLMHILDNAHASLGGSLLVMSSYDRSNLAHNLLSSLNAFTLWQTAIVGLGLAKVSNKPTGPVIGLVFGLWILWTVATSLLGWGWR